MPSAEYEVLLKRVAEFNAIEQKLINTRDELDRELDTYKRLARFNARALDLNSPVELQKLAAEAIIDIFELEGAIVATHMADDTESDFYCEGSLSREQAGQMLNTLLHLKLPQQDHTALLLNEDYFEPYVGLSGMHQCIFFRHCYPDNNCHLILCGYISKENRPIYTLLTNRDREVFNILAQTAIMILDRIQDRHKMWEQLQTIKESEKKLKTLSVIATKSKNGVVISDRKGLITWVNDSFEQVTGYKLKDALGHTPGSLLQGPATNPATVRAMSESINAGRGIATPIVNYTSSGEQLNIELEIIPVADDNGEVTGFVALQQDVTKQEQYIAELNNANAELKKTNSEMDVLVYRISHDLRAPLLSVKGLIYIMQDDPVDETNANYLKMMLSSVNRLDESIINILHYSRNSRLKVEYEQVDIRQMVNNIFLELKYLPDHPVKTSVYIAGSPLMYTDRQRLGTLLTNLISNAFKYSRNVPEVESFIRFSLKTSAGQTEIIIEDNGEGIAPEHQSKIFNMFYRASSSNVGSGLGLYICKEMIAKMGGTISVTSQKNVGTSFTVTLPIVTQPDVEINAPALNVVSI